MNTKIPGQALLERRIEELGLRREVEDELAQILIDHEVSMKRYILTGTPGCGKTSIIRSLEVIAKADPNRVICVARELTKHFEEYRRGDASSVLAHYAAHPPKGEITLLIGSFHL